MRIWSKLLTHWSAQALVLLANAAWRSRLPFRLGMRPQTRLRDALVPAHREAESGPPYTAGDDVDYGPVVTAAAKENILRLINSGVEQGADLVVDNRDFTLQGYEDGFFVGPHLFDNVTTDMDIYKQEILALFCRWSAPKPTRKPSATPWITSTATVPRSSPVTVTPPVTSPTASTSAWSASTSRSRFRWPITPLAAGRSRALVT